MSKSVTDVEYRGGKYFVTYDIEQVKANLETYGVCTVPACLKPEDIEKMNDGMWEMLETMSASFTGVRPTRAGEAIVPINRDDPKTWSNIREFVPLHRFLLQHFGMGHAKYVWEVRANKRIMRIFAKLLGCDKKDLACSMDGVGIFLPRNDTTTTITSSHHGQNRSRQMQEQHLWLHTDQRFDYSKDPNTHQSVQAWVTGFNVENDGPTLVFYEGSNRFHEEFGRHFGLDKGHHSDWFRLEKPEHYEFFESRGCKLRAIKCPAGSCVLWDSRTFHCGISGRNGSQQKRNVVYVSYVNKKHISKKMLAKRAAIYREKRMTTHRPEICRLFPKTPRTYGRTLQTIHPPPMFTAEDSLTPEMRSLIPLTTRQRP